jgi:hypothetical protein
VEAQCGLHALNNAIGGPFFNKEDMVAASFAYLQEARAEGLPERRGDHVGPRGWYSEAVLAFTPRWKVAQHTMGRYTQMALDLDNPIQPNEVSAHRIRDENAHGVIVNKDQTHWVTFKATGEQLWLLDSELEPAPYTFEEYLRFLKRYRHAFLLYETP